MATGAPIVPIWIQGGIDAWPRWKPLPGLRANIRVIAMPPIRPQDFEHAEKRTRASLMTRELEAGLLRGRDKLTV